MSTAQPRPLDLKQWPSVEAALEHLAPRSREFEAIVMPCIQRYVAAVGGGGLFLMFVMSTLTRARGLHEATVREIEQANPHATFPLMRSLLETAALAFHTSDNPAYVDALIDAPENRRPGIPKRRSPQSLVDGMDRNGHTAFLGRAYRELCETTHFGHLAMWAAWEVDNEDERGVSWTTVPRFRGDTALAACGQLEELTDLMLTGCKRMGDRLLADAGLSAMPFTGHEPARMPDHEAGNVS